MRGGADGRSGANRAPRQGAAAVRRSLEPPARVPRRNASGAGRKPAAPAVPFVRGLRRAIVLLLLLGLCGFLIDGASRPANPKLVPAHDPGAAKGAPAMGSATLTVSSAKATSTCVLEAVTQEQQNYGLMGRTSLAPYAGMAFVWSSPSNALFYMKDTLIPLSIAWFDAQGRFETETLMPPCPRQVVTCPTYGPQEPYTLAVEVPAGQLGSLGIGPGSTAHVGAGC